MSPLERAIAIAARAHAGQKDKAGEAYILHPLRVMLACKTPDARIVGVLHDVVEDTPVTLKALQKEGFSKKVLAALALVTKPKPDGTIKRDLTEQEKDAEYFAFVRGTLRNAIAREVKRADLIDNMDMSRIKKVTPKDRKRLARYRKALEMLDGKR